MRVKLIRKFAECIDGVDLSGSIVGDMLDLPRRAAWLLKAEGWAISAEDDRKVPDPDQSSATREDQDAWVVVAAWTVFLARSHSASESSGA